MNLRDYERKYLHSSINVINIEIGFHILPQQYVLREFPKTALLISISKSHLLSGDVSNNEKKGALFYQQFNKYH